MYSWIKELKSIRELIILVFQMELSGKKWGFNYLAKIKERYCVLCQIENSRWWASLVACMFSVKVCQSKMYSLVFYQVFCCHYASYAKFQNSHRKPKVFVLQILRHYLTKEGRVQFFLLFDTDKRTLRSEIWTTHTFENSWDFANWKAYIIQVSCKVLKTNYTVAPHI